MIGQRLATAVARYRPRLISVDVFDTLLLRTTRPEFVRFADVATLQDRALRAGGHPSPGMARLLATRLSITRQAYQETRLPNAARGEVNFRVILADLCAELGLPSSFVADFLMIELEYEATVLSLNRPLLAALAQQTVPIIATSDTPLWSQDIAALLYRLAPNHPINRIFASGEVGLTKRRGGLYAHLASEVGVAPENILHLGDNPAADRDMASQQGLQCLYLPRSTAWRWLHHGRDRLIRQKLRRQGWIP